MRTSADRFDVSPTRRNSPSCRKRSSLACNGSGMARIEPEFTKRNAKLIGLSADPVDRHSAWAKDIEETQGAAVKYPMIADHDLKVAKLYNMLYITVSRIVPSRRTAW